MKWFLLLSLLGCAQVTSLNLKKHEFGIVPTKIIWFQIAGLEEEQLAMLRFQYGGERKTAFEENTCLGKTWSYNLYQLRPKAEMSFLSQMTGKKNIKGTCEDASLRPVWSFLSANGYTTGLFENENLNQQSLRSLEQCGDKGKAFLGSMYFWTRQEPAKGAETFHYAENIPFKMNEVIYDRTCSKNSCFSTVFDDLRSIYGQFKTKSSKHLFLVRDFSYLNALEKKDFIKAREILADIERTLAEVLSYSKDNNDYLVLLTTGSSKMVDMPDQGLAWYDFEKSGKNLQLKRSLLTNLVLASGARAENFCGLYDESEILQRILSGPKQQGLELKIINPFK